MIFSVPVRPKGVGWSCSQSSVQASHILPHQTEKTISLWTWLFAKWYCPLETGKGIPQTVATKVSLHAVTPPFPLTGTKGPLIKSSPDLFLEVGMVK